jgi:hypothetical protein
VPGNGCDLGDPTSRTLSNPQPGVWEVVVEARRTSDNAFARYSLTASVLGATVSPNPDTIASATLGQGVSRSYTMTNQFGTFTGRATGTALGSARLANPTITMGGAQQQFVMSVPAGTTKLVAKIGNASDGRADLDLFVFRCAPSCTLVGQSAGSSAEETVTINNPAAGTWVALVDPFNIPSGSTTYRYRDVFSNAAYGTIATSDADASRPAGGSWTSGATVTAAATPGSGRVLLGNIEIRTSGTVLIGTGDVIVQSVS